MRRALYLAMGVANWAILGGVFVFVGFKVFVFAMASTVGDSLQYQVGIFYVEAPPFLGVPLFDH